MRHFSRTLITLTLLGNGLLFAQAASIGKPCSGKNDPEPCTTIPQLIYSIQPDYSEQARSSKLEGTCTLALIVGVDGRPIDVQVLQRLGMGLDEKAIEAVQKWRFKPGIREGKPAPKKIAVEVEFRLDERK